MSEALVPSGDSQAVQAPADWDKAVSAAYFRALGGSQAAAAEAAGVSERTVRAWEASPWWPEAQRQALARWRSDLTAASRKSLLDAVAVDGDLALKLLERLDPSLSGKELTVGRVHALMSETLRAIRQEFDDELAQRTIALLKRIWAPGQAA